MNTEAKSFTLENRLAGVLLGTAVGDALGLPSENLSPERIWKFWSGTWQMRFVGRWGMFSDDTEHTLLVAQSLLAHPVDPEAFQRCLAWKLRWWFASLPAGVGIATARACLKLWIGFPPKSAAVTSAGSGPAMRCAIIGAVFANDELRRKQFVSASSSLTHRGWKAELAAQAVAACVALATRFERQPSIQEVMAELRPLSNEKEWQQLLSIVETGLQNKLSVQGFAKELGLGRGVSGYSLHVVPIALFAWLRHPGDFRKTLVSVLECGGDTDTVGAIAGALTGSVTGDVGIPEAWVNRICEWPRSVSFIRCLAKRLVLQSRSVEPQGTLRYFWPGTLVRNVAFLIVVLMHGFRRLLPPY